MSKKRISRRDIKTPHTQPIKKGKNIKRIDWVKLIIVAIIALSVAYYYFIRTENRIHHSITLSNPLHPHGINPE
jgi:hypothetical protein